MHEHERNSESNFVMSGKPAAGTEGEETYDYSTRGGGGARKSMKPILIAGAGLLLAVIVVLMFMSGAPKTAERDQLKGIESRLKVMEEKLAKLEWIDTGLARLDRKEKEIASISERMVQLEATLNKKVDQLSKDVAKAPAKPAEPAAVKAESAAHKTEAVAAKPPAAAAGKSEKEIKSKVHVVQKGETIYGISRKYGIPADQLLKLNKLSPKDPIKPGQQLVLAPSKTG
jgi:LysM repeat protein